MAGDPDNDGLDNPESHFLIALWRHLDAASDIAIDKAVMGRLDEVLENCEAAAALIRGWRAGR